MLEKKHRRNRSISLTDKGFNAIQKLEESSINVSAFLEKILIKAVNEMEGERNV